ncbi:hypothetical protein TNCV_178321 [Trichonephila clavipes]|nr:hypothetical protein TNCV_178321 [Trichonephila clavipes]
MTPARSPELNPIENVWDALGRQVAGRNYPPTNKNTLIRTLTEEWDKLPQQLLDNVVQTIYRDHGTQMVMLVNHGSWFRVQGPLNNHRIGRTMHVKSVEAQYPLIGAVW